MRVLFVLEPKLYSKFLDLLRDLTGFGKLKSESLYSKTTSIEFFDFVFWLALVCVRSTSTLHRKTKEIFLLIVYNLLFLNKLQVSFPFHVAYLINTDKVFHPSIVSHSILIVCQLLCVCSLIKRQFSHL